MRPQTKLMDIIPDLYFLWVLPLIASSTTLGSALHGVFFVEAKYHTRFSCSCVPFLMFFFFGGGWNSSWYTFLLGIFIVEFLNDTCLNQISAGLERAKLRR